MKTVTSQNHGSAGCTQGLSSESENGSFQTAEKCKVEIKNNFLQSSGDAGIRGHGRNESRALLQGSSRTGILLLLVSLFFLCGCREQIIHNLTEQQVNRLISGLGEVSIKAERVKQSDGKWALATDNTDSLKAIKYLNDSRLLPEEMPSTAGKASVVSSREDQRFMHERALSHEIEKTLGAVPGVLDVRVHINLPPVDPFFGQPVQSSKGSASVLMVVRAGGEGTEKGEIASVVSGAAGVPASEISVIVKTALSKELPAVDKKNDSSPAVETVKETEVPSGLEVKNPEALKLEEKAKVMVPGQLFKTAMGTPITGKIPARVAISLFAVICLITGVTILIRLRKPAVKKNDFLEVKDVMLADFGD